MQTLRKRTSPFKYKNDASRFMGEGITFKAKLIGILEVSEARGDKMCQDALNDLKTAIRAAGEHKQRITIGISIDGLRLRDEKTGDSLYHHPVHKISFIAQDMSDSRAFGYIFGSPDIGHRFFGIKTDKTASQVVIAMRDLFQVVFELKKREIELAKHHTDHHHGKCGTSGFLDTISFTKEDAESDKGKGKLLKSRGCTTKVGESEAKGAAATEAIADLLDLEHELNSIQQGINQMDKITPPDPFGPLSKNDSYVDPFDDSFSSKVENATAAEDRPTSSAAEGSLKKPLEDISDMEKQSSFFGATASATKANFFSQFSSGIGKPKMEESWFHHDTESLFNETTNVGNAEPTSSPIALTTPGPEPDQAEGRRSPVKLDLFTELDPLGTGRVKPYVDKKDFFQELKNPPKKVLKELITENVSTEPSTSFSFPATFRDEAVGPPPTHESLHPSREESRSSIMSKSDFFVGGDPFEKTDPFQEENFSSGFSPMFGPKASVEGLFEDKSWSFEQSSSKEVKEEKPGKSSPSNLLFTSPLRVSLPPEKSEGYGAVPKSPPTTPEELKFMRRKYYQITKQWTLEGSEDSPVHEEPFVSTRVTSFLGRSETERRSPFKDRFSSVQSPPLSVRGEKPSSRTYSSAGPSLDKTNLDHSLRVKTSALFTIKPPPLPARKQNQPNQRTLTRISSKEDNTYPYDYLEAKETVCNGFHTKEELKCVKLKKQLFTGKDSPPTNELRKQNSELKDANIPVLPPPPNRKSSTDGGKTTSGRKSQSGTADGSILNIKLNQLDNTGLENLAVTLGIPSGNIYSMTLQELTKMLADKYLKSEETKTENPRSDSFEVDFEANFAKMEMSNQCPQPSYDKYAVFKELIENENKGPEDAKEEESEERGDEKSEAREVKTFSQTKEEEDKYAALRHLSLNAEIPGQELEEEEEAKAENAFEMEQSKDEPTTSPGPNQTLEKSQSLENVEEKDEKGSAAQKMDLEKTPEQEIRKETRFDSEQNLFPLMDDFSDDKKATPVRDNWATFEKPDFAKSDFAEAVDKKAADSFNENENSPFSSDGREEVREIPFRWHQDSYQRKKRGDVPWQDDDESWDDYSPKESYCSDESSHEERSPEGARSERYTNPSWREVCGKGSKTDRMWNRRDKWQEETEDEFEDTWRKHRDRLGSYDSERKTFRHPNNYENLNKRYDRCNSRGEPWNEDERHVHCYGARRKRSESDNDYRKRCDSDASDKECVWTVQKSYPDCHGRSGKQKPHHGSGHSFRSCGEHCHESRSKHRKGSSQKRPSSASESNRNYEKMFSPSEYGYKTAEKTYPGKRESEKEEYQRYQHSWKESRHRSDMEYPHSYSSYDRKASGHHSKGRVRRGSNSGQSDTFPSPNKREGPEVGYFEPFPEKTYKYKKPETARHFQFETEPDNFEKPKKSLSDHSCQDFSPKRRGNQWASANGKTEGETFFAGRPSEEKFADFRDDFKNSPKRAKGEGTSRGNGSFPPAEPVAPQVKNRAHSAAMLNSQEPPTTTTTTTTTLRKSDSINIFSRDKDPFEDDDFFDSAS